MFAEKEHTPASLFKEYSQRTRERLALITIFNQFKDCPIPLYRNNETALKIIYRDRTLLNKVDKTKPITWEDIPELNSEIHFIEVTKVVPSEMWERFYLLRFKKFGHYDEAFFIDEEIRYFSGFSEEIINEYPILRYWLHFLNERRKHPKNNYIIDVEEIKNLHQEYSGLINEPLDTFKQRFQDIKASLPHICPNETAKDNRMRFIITLLGLIDEQHRKGFSEYVKLRWGFLDWANKKNLYFSPVEKRYPDWGKIKEILSKQTS